MQGGPFSPLSLQSPTLIETKSGASASYAFSSIPQNFAALRIVLLGRSTAAAVAVPVALRFNGDTGSNYDQQIFYSNGTTVAAVASAASATAQFATILGSTATANAAGMAILDIPAYASTTFLKVATSTGGRFGTSGATATYEAATFAINWRSTAAITSVTIADLSGGSFVAGSTCSLYGIPG